MKCIEGKECPRVLPEVERRAGQAQKSTIQHQVVAAGSQEGSRLPGCTGQWCRGLVQILVPCQLRIRDGVQLSRRSAAFSVLQFRHQSSMERGRSTDADNTMTTAAPMSTPSTPENRNKACSSRNHLHSSVTSCLIRGVKARDCRGETSADCMMTCTSSSRR